MAFKIISFLPFFRHTNPSGTWQILYLDSLKDLISSSLPLMLSSRALTCSPGTDKLSTHYTLLQIFEIKSVNALE